MSRELARFIVVHFSTSGSWEPDLVNPSSCVLEKPTGWIKAEVPLYSTVPASRPVGSTQHTSNECLHERDKEAWPPTEGQVEGNKYTLRTYCTFHDA